ncbi:hypothetical protein [Limosilactobacillus fermentum]
MAKYGAPKEYQAALLFARRRLEDPRLTIGGQLIDKADPDGGLLSYGLKIANSHHDWYKSMAQSLQPTIATYPADLQAIVQTAIELGIKVHAAPTQVTLSLDEHQEVIPTAQVWELPDGSCCPSGLLPRTGQLHRCGGQTIIDQSKRPAVK